MLTSKQRSVLKSIAQTEDTIFQVGKGGINDNMTDQLSDALRVRELIKIKVLDNSMVSAGEAAAEIAEKTSSEVVQVIGNKVVLFKRNPNDPKIDLGDLPKAKKKPAAAAMNVKAVKSKPSFKGGRQKKYTRKG